MKTHGTAPDENTDDALAELGDPAHGSEALDPDSTAGRALDPENAVDEEVTHREGAFGDDSSKDDVAPIP